MNCRKIGAGLAAQHRSNHARTRWRMTSNRPAIWSSGSRADSFRDKPIAGEFAAQPHQDFLAPGFGKVVSGIETDLRPAGADEQIVILLLHRSRICAGRSSSQGPPCDGKRRSGLRRISAPALAINASSPASGPGSRAAQAAHTSRRAPGPRRRAPAPKQSAPDSPFHLEDVGLVLVFHHVDDAAVRAHLQALQRLAGGEHRVRCEAPHHAVDH